jgi:hypothetical protein
MTQALYAHMNNKTIKKIKSTIVGILIGELNSFTFKAITNK